MYLAAHASGKPPGPTNLFSEQNNQMFNQDVKLLPLPQPPPPRARPHERTDKSKRPESHPTKECARACERCLNTEPNYFYCPIILVIS
jgi:hypothetical protein